MDNATRSMHAFRLAAVSALVSPKPITMHEQT
jgi:hypothetical protein